MILGAVVVLAVTCAVVARRRAGRRGMARPASLLLGVLARDAGATDGGWSRAMLAEHDVIGDPRLRARFARGAILATLTRGPRWAEMPVDVVVDGAFVATAAALAATCLVRYPGLRASPTWIPAVVLFVVGLAVYGAAAVTLARFGSPGGHRKAAISGLVAMFLGFVMALAPSQLSVGVAGALALVPGLTALFDQRSSGRRAGGWVTGCTSALSTGLGVFVGFVTATLVTNGGTPTRALLAAARPSGIHPYSAWAVGDALGGASFLLVYVLVVGSLVAVLVSAVAAPRIAPSSGFG